MKSFAPGILVALAVSLLLHGVVVSKMLWEYLPTDATDAWAVGDRKSESNIEDRSATEMGESTGIGFASNSSEGDRPMQSQEADVDQALLSLDPAGLSDIGAPPSPWAGPTGDNGQMGVPSPDNFSPMPQESSESQPFGVRPSPAIPPLPKRQPKPIIDQIALSDTLKEPTTAPSDEDAETPQEEQKPQPPALANAEEITANASPAPPGAPGKDVASADVAMESDSESDPFAKLGTVDFSAGKVSVRFGRKIKTVRPRLTLAGRYDAFASGVTKVVMALIIDETGAVKDVRILRSSGSNEIDLPIQRAMFQWWVEPTKDKDGKPIPDVVVFTVGIR